MHTLAIATKYHGPTGTLGARIRVKISGARAAFYPFRHESSDVHETAAREHLAYLRLPAPAELESIAPPDDSGRLFIVRFHRAV